MKLTKLYFSVVILLCTVGEVVAQTQQIIIGNVTELFGKSAEPLIGVNINIMNSQERSLGGTVTNMNGQYRLAIPEKEKDLTLVFSYIGMKTKRIKYTGQKSLNVTMESTSEAIGQVEIVAERKDRNDLGVGLKEQTSATQKINMEDLVATSPVTSVEEVLQGQLGGVDITLSGDPGAKSTIFIRGASTLNASSDPLIVIDGVPYSDSNTSDFDFATANEEDLGALLNISPNDIESVEVLKDASATAVWGTKGANGVLIITTKKGSVGKTRFSFSSKWTAKVEPKTIPMLNGDEYVALMQDAIWNSANYVGVSQASNYLRLLFNTPEIGDNPDWQYYDEYHQNTDWLDLVRQNALSSDNSFSMSGGGNRATYRLSLGYATDDGTTIGTSMNRFNSTLRIDYNFSKKLRFGANVTYTQTDKDANWATTVRSEAFKKMPNKSPYVIDDVTHLPLDQYFNRQTTDWEGVFKSSNDKGDATNYNPVAMAKESKNNTLQRETRAIIDANYKILPGFTYSGYVSIKMNTSKNTKFLPQSVTGAVWMNAYANQAYDAMSESLSIQTENKLQFMKNWNGKHNLITNLRWNTSQSTSSSYASKTSGMASSGLSDPVVGTSVQSMGSGESEGRSISGMGMINYTLLGRYVFQALLNIESSSAMGRNQRMGYFPAFGVNWNIQDEPFLAAAKEKWLDMAKIRLSYGESGTPPKGNSVYMGAFKSTGDNYMNMSSIAPSRMQLDQLKWESLKEYNIGADFGFLHNRLRFTFDYYWRDREDILNKNYRIPSTTGFSNIAYFNSGSTRNQGWEFRTDLVFFENKDWRISGYFNVSRNKNKITELQSGATEGIKNADEVKNGEYAYITQVGRPIGSFFGYRYKGVYQNKDATYARDAEGNVMNDLKGNPIVMKNGSYLCYPGDAMYEDINHDGVINKYDIVYLGNTQPLVTGGGGVTVKYKQVTLSAFFHGRFGQSIVNMARMNNESMFGSNNQSKAVLRRWKNEGDNTDIPRALYNEGRNYLGSDRFVEKASFVRLKSMTLSYGFPRKICNRFNVNSLSVFVTGYNLFTWTNYTGQDPEVSVKDNLAIDTATTPVAKRFSFGLNMSF